MIRFILGKIVHKAAVLLIITFLTFVTVNISRVDPAQSYVRRTSMVADEARVEKLREEMGLDKPVHIQYLNWLKSALSLDFGKSLLTGNEVASDIGERARPTLMLVGISFAMVVFAAFALGIISTAGENGPIDHFIRLITTVGISLPNFWLGFILLYVFSVKLGIMEVSGGTGLKKAFLPAITMAVVPICHFTSFLRSTMLEEMGKDYVTYARARGISKWRILTRQVMPNAVQPLIPLLLQNLGYLFLGSAVIEAVFSWPGLGMYTFHAIVDRDFPVVAAYILLSAVVFTTCSTAADILNVSINKKLLKEVC